MSRERAVEQSLRIFSEKSKESIELFKQKNFVQKSSNTKLNRAVGQYISRWKDTTRPAMLALAFEAAGGEQGKAALLQFAMLHIDATMDIHDDIMDESVAKKGVKTIYGKFGKEAAMLIGDIFMVKGFNHLHRVLEYLPVEQQQSIMKTIEDFLSEVVDAHVMETALKADRWHVKPEKYLQVLSKKAADIEGRMKVGAIYGEASEQEINALSVVGRKLGTLLAVRAEYVDLFEVDELSNRVDKECLPLPILYAIRDKLTAQKIRALLSNGKITQKDCAKIVDLTLSSAEIKPLTNHLQNMRRDALRSLATLKETSAKSELQAIVASMLEDL